MEKELKILFVEDMPADHELTVFELKNAGLIFSAIRVETKFEFKMRLKILNPTLLFRIIQCPNLMA